jgi:hypothetical protein
MQSILLLYTWKVRTIHTKWTQQEVTSLVFFPEVRTIPRGVWFVFTYSFAAEKPEKVRDS